jgi:hypothetical protein
MWMYRNRTRGPVLRMQCPRWFRSQISALFWAGDYDSSMTKTVGFFGNFTLSNTTLQSAFRKWDVAGATAEVDLGATVKGVTAGRVLALGVLSLAAKKDKSKVFVTVTLADGAQVLIEGPVKHEKQARAFAAKINQVSQMTM